MDFGETACNHCIVYLSLRYYCNINLYLSFLLRHLICIQYYNLLHCIDWHLNIYICLRGSTIFYRIFYRILFYRKLFIKLLSHRIFIECYFIEFTLSNFILLNDTLSNYYFMELLFYRMLLYTVGIFFNIYPSWLLW